MCVEVLTLRRYDNLDHISGSNFWEIIFHGRAWAQAVQHQNRNFNKDLEEWIEVREKTVQGY